MRTFFGGTFIEKEKLEEAGIKHPIKLEYYKQINEDVIKSFEKTKYGIEIVKIQYNEDSKMTREVGNIDDISENEAEVISIINKLKENYVTPIVMKDIIEDMKYEITPIQ